MTSMYTLRRGGAYERFLMMLEAFLERDCEIHCISLTPIKIRNPLFKNHILPLPFFFNHSRFTHLFVLLLFPIYAFLIGWRRKVDLFIAFNSLYAFTQAMPKLILKKPMITLIRGDFKYGLKVRGSFKNFMWLNKMIEYFGFIASDRILTVNKAIQSDIMAAIGKRRRIDVEILYNNILVSQPLYPDDRMKVRNRYRIPPEAGVLVTAGILNRGKNIELLLRSLPKIKIKNLFLFIIGEGSTREDTSYLECLKRMTEEFGIREEVIFTGWLPKMELWRIFQASDLFLLPSLNEGMPNVLLEAIGLDLPCLGSRIAGIEDILHYEELMFDPQDEGAIANKIRQFFSEGTFSKDIIQLCRERKKMFFFDWKERVFKMVTEGSISRGEACQSR